jgi:hypothetical protein
MTYDRRIAVDIDEVDVGELEIADYIVYLFALDTYIRWVEEVRQLDVESADEADLDAVTRHGLALLRSADGRVLDALARLLRETITNKASLRMLDAVMRTSPTVRGVGVRALRLRTILSRGGSITVKAVFGSSTRARKEVLEAIGAGMMDDADAALSKFAAITLRNKRLEAWIDLASETARPVIPVATNPIQEAVRAASDQVVQVRTMSMVQAGMPPASDQAREASARQQLALEFVEQNAREAAQKAIIKSGGNDGPVTRAEAIAIATTAVAATDTDPDDIRTLPQAFINDGMPLDPEQQAAALTDGRVIVAAGAGSGKSTTLVSRITYLVQERGVLPSKILACSFNRKAANELKSKVQAKVGKDIADQMSIGTMHSLFLRFIVGDSRAGIPAFGTPEEQALFREERLIADQEPGKPPKRGPKPINMTKTIQGIFRECKKSLPRITGFPPEWFEEIPRAKRANLYVNVWKGNDVSPDEAMRQARRKGEKIAALWYQFYMGLKGDLPGWKPPCNSKSADKWWDTYRKGGERLGDLDDQLRVFRDILLRDPKARKQIQSMFDHIMVDEAQDRNAVQAQIFDLMSEHIGDGSDGRSLWIVGDDKQCVSVDTPVATPNGPVPAGDLKVGDTVLSYRNGEVTVQRVRHVMSTTWSWGYRITTESGRTLTMSPNHKIWASGPLDPGYIVYLAYRRDRGFWLGSTDNDALDLGLSYGHGPQAEGAERLWVLGVHVNKDMAITQEMSLSMSYQIPTRILHHTWLSHLGVDPRKLDTSLAEFGANGTRLLEARDLSFDYPSWMCRNPAVRTVTLVAHAPGGSQVIAEWPVEEAHESVNNTQVRHARKFVRKCFANYRDALAFAEGLEHELRADLKHRLFVDAETVLDKTTASALFPGMSVVVSSSGHVMLDKIVAVDRVDGSFVDLDIDDASNFFWGRYLVIEQHLSVPWCTSGDIQWAAWQAWLEDSNDPYQLSLRAGDCRGS